MIPKGCVFVLLAREFIKGRNPEGLMRFKVINNDVLKCVPHTEDTLEFWRWPILRKSAQ